MDIWYRHITSIFLPFLGLKHFLSMYLYTCGLFGKDKFSLRPCLRSSCARMLPTHLSWADRRRIVRLSKKIYIQTLSIKLKNSQSSSLEILGHREMSFWRSVPTSSYFYSAKISKPNIVLLRPRSSFRRASIYYPGWETSNSLLFFFAIF